MWDGQKVPRNDWEAEKCVDPAFLNFKEAVGEACGFIRCGHCLLRGQLRCKISKPGSIFPCLIWEALASFVKGLDLHISFRVQTWGCFHLRGCSTLLLFYRAGLDKCYMPWNCYDDDRKSRHL
ncbi:hypothetical protein K1719_037717 [Acacia pycnantha]|nr:hypothetical protein K1719_037717 [Acacia pycnantha]